MIHIYQDLAKKLKSKIDQVEIDLVDYDNDRRYYDVAKQVEATVGNIEAIANITFTVSCSEDVGGELNGWEESLLIQEIDSIEVSDLEVFMEGEYMEAISRIVENKLNEIIDL